MAARKKADTAPPAAPDTSAQASAATAPSRVSQEGYCVKCKTKRMMKGTCPECGTNMNRIMGKA